MTQTKGKSDLTPMLLSALVFPGLGQFKLRRPIRGAIMAVAALACLIGFVVQFITPFQHVILSHLSLEQPSNPHEAVSLWHIVVLWVGLLVAVWVASVVDVMITARQPALSRKFPVYKNTGDQPPPPTKSNLPPPPTPKLG
jgi:hypothetical protein